MAEQMAIETELEHLKEILKRNKREYIHCPPHLEDMKPKGYDAEQCAIEYEHLVGYIEELIQCRAIGTVEELQALKDKSVAKKVVEIHKSEAIEDREYMGEEALYGYCPNCGGLICDVWNFVTAAEITDIKSEISERATDAWIDSVTIAAADFVYNGTGYSHTITNENFKTDSEVLIAYEQETKISVKEYIQGDGSLTIVLKKAPKDAVVITSIHIINR